MLAQHALDVEAGVGRRAQHLPGGTVGSLAELAASLTLQGELDVVLALPTWVPNTWDDATLTGLFGVPTTRAQSNGCGQPITSYLGPPVAL